MRAKFVVVGARGCVTRKEGHTREAKIRDGLRAEGWRIHDDRQTFSAPDGTTYALPKSYSKERSAGEMKPIGADGASPWCWWEIGKLFIFLKKLETITNVQHISTKT